MVGQKDYSIANKKTTHRAMEGDDFMIFLVIKAIAEAMASHFARGATMLAGIIALLAIITVLIVRILHTKKADPIRGRFFD